MAFNHITQISQNLAKLEWLTDDWVKEEVGKNANKRGRQQVATHIARQFAVVPNPRDLKRIQCSSIADGEELRYLAQVWVNKDGITETRCECLKKQSECVDGISFLPPTSMYGIETLTKVFVFVCLGVIDASTSRLCC